MFEKFKGWWKKMISPSTIQDKMKIVPAISYKMQKAIQLWTTIYMNETIYDNDQNPLKSLNLGYIVADEKARMACLELQTKVYDPNSVDEDGELLESYTDKETRASFLNSQYQGLIDRLRHKIVPGVALGSMIIKPIPDGENKRIYFDFVMASEFFPISFTIDGKLIHAVFTETIQKKDVRYTRIETHELKKGVITITQEAYKSMSSNSSDELGQKISLGGVAEWANLQPQTIIKSTNGIELDRLLVAYFTMPEANNIDIHSNLGVSAYSSATDLIKDAYDIYTSMQWEYKGGELAIDAPRNAVKERFDDKGNVIVSMPQKEKRLFREVNVSGSGGSEIYNVFNPAFRDESYRNGLNIILRKIEDCVGIARGTISQVDVEARTATEIKSLKQRTYQSNHDLQQKLQEVLEDIVYIMDIYTSIYNMAPSGEYASQFEWDDSILVDVGEELKQKLALVAQGALYPEEVTSWYLDIPLKKRFMDIQSYNELKSEYNPEPEVIEQPF